MPAIFTMSPNSTALTFHALIIYNYSYFLQLDTDKLQIKLARTATSFFRLYWKVKNGNAGKRKNFCQLGCFFITEWRPGIFTVGVLRVGSEGMH